MEPLEETLVPAGIGVASVLVADADRGRGRLGRFSGNAFQQRQIVQELRIGVFQKALLARSVNVLHGLVNLRRRRIQDHAVDRGAAQ